MKLAHKFIAIDDVNIHYVEAQPKNTLLTTPSHSQSTIVFLHGFPEYWATWQAQLHYFSANYRVIAPDLPGYNLSDKPHNSSFFQVNHLIEFFAKLISTLAPNEKIFLVAHDWGGAIAWPLAAFFPQLIEKLIILNAAHPSTFTREMINNPEQQQKSEYIHQLIASDAVQTLTDNNFAYLVNKILVSAKPDTFTEKNLTNYRHVWQQTGAVNGMLQYYRAMPQLAASKHHKHTNTSTVTDPANMKIPNIRVNVPTLILWGEQDQAFVIENLNQIEDYVPNCQVKRFPDSSHWLQHEQPTQINQAIERFISPSR
jgi:pimeloyl-ACP methyl ester carboxylesterase